MADGFFGSHGNRLRSKTGEGLGQRLAEIDSTVSRRSSGRSTAQRERWSLVHYLRTLHQNGLVRFPLEIERGERPDFVVRMGDQRFGLEVTEAGTTEFQRTTAQLEKAPPGSILERSEIREPGEGLRGMPYLGDEPERLWTEDLVGVIQGKIKKMAMYRDVGDCHLLIYDNSEFRALTQWTVTELPSRLAAAIDLWRGTAPPAQRHFCQISILRDRVLLYDVAGDRFLLPVPLSDDLPPLLPLTRLGVDEERLRSFCEAHAIRKLGFFGSVREDRFGPSSDVDVLVEFEAGHSIGLIEIAGLELELDRLLGRKADLRTVPDLSRYFREKVVREKTELAYVAG